MMKFLILLLTLLPVALCAQLSEGDEMKQLFWNSNIGNIIEMDMDSILLQTRFPLEVDRLGRKEKWTKEQFKAKVPILFDSGVLEQLGKDTYSSMEYWTYEDETSPTAMIVLYPGNEEFNVVVLSFKQFDGDWKLYRIDMHME